MFGFTTSPRRIFEHDFLRSVMVTIVYDPIVVTEHKDTIKTSLLNYYPRLLNKNDSSLSIEFRPNEKTPIVNMGEEIAGYQLISENGLDNMLINNTTTVLNFSGATYKRFEQILPIIEVLGVLFEKIGVQQIKKLSIRKLNVANFETSALSTVFYDILATRYSEKMIATMPADENFVQHMMMTSMKDGEYRLNVNYGIPPILNTQSPIKGIFVEDIDISQEAILTSADLAAKLQVINQAVYDVFFGMNSEQFKRYHMGYVEE